jgi:DNA-binding PadR family transcriptional regulator
MPNATWNHGTEPKSRDVGLFSDLTLFAAALGLASDRGAVTITLLQQELEQRLRGLFLARPSSPKVASQLVRELCEFHWIKKEAAAGIQQPARYTITAEGERALRTWRRDRREFRLLLASEMQRVYVVPGWFVARLWKINRDGQGELIIPSPSEEWKPAFRSRDSVAWTAEIEAQTRLARERVLTTAPGAFPVSEDNWVLAVQRVWGRLGELQPKNPQAEAYQPRTRLHLAMREAAIRLLFALKPYQETVPDFPGNKRPAPPRSFRAWCLRLAELELIFYTDTHPQVRGRLLFPTSVFRGDAPEERFTKVPGILDPTGRPLWLHRPLWGSIRDGFWRTIVDVHRQTSLTAKSLYVSLLDVRDEVCRQLRLSGDLFDQYLTDGLRELPRSGFPYSVSVETDIREDQLSGRGRRRRPVYVGGVPHSLIAVAHLVHTT